MFPKPAGSPLFSSQFLLCVKEIGRMFYIGDAYFCIIHSEKLEALKLDELFKSVSKQGR